MPLAALLAPLAVSVAPEDPAELRGVWLTNVDGDVLLSRRKIAAATEFLAAHTLSAVFPAVWNRGFTLFPNAVMDGLFGRPDWCALQRARISRRSDGGGACAGAAPVMAWFEFCSSWGTGGGHLLGHRALWAATGGASHVKQF